ncbi:MAG: FliM/FliN family flagellar motor switch protein [Planctomycetota bacterium]
MATDLETILKLEVPLIVTIGSRRFDVEEVLGLGPGSILDMNKSSDEHLEVMINNKPVGTGTAVKVGENFGVRVSHIGSPAERIEALAG